MSKYFDCYTYMLPPTLKAPMKNFARGDLCLLTVDFARKQLTAVNTVSQKHQEEATPQHLLTRRLHSRPEWFAICELSLYGPKVPPLRKPRVLLPFWGCEVNGPTTTACSAMSTHTRTLPASQIYCRSISHRIGCIDSVREALLASLAFCPCCVVLGGSARSFLSSESPGRFSPPSQAQASLLSNRSNGENKLIPQLGFISLLV